jgi:drug/metabolite transporter (DMT)-like permease
MATAVLATTRPPRWKTLSGFAIIYFVWGSTFLAIRIGVEEVPPFLLASMRFVAAGLALYVWMLLKRERNPSPREWASIALLAMLMIAFSYGLVFWAEQRVPSGLTAVMQSTIPALMSLSEILILRTQRLTARLALALAVGFCGVAVLMVRSLDLAGAPIDHAGAVALICAATSWSVASALSRKLPLPHAKTMSSGAQMLVGGVMLALIAGIRGEFAGFHPAAVSAKAWFALLYLIVAGSIVAFTAYVWLIHHHSPTKVATYAYVNPVIAVLLGYFAAGEPLGQRTIIGSGCVLLSVVMITTAKSKKPVAAEAAGP